LEVRIIDNWYTKLEYRYSDYNDFQYREGTETYALGFERHQLVTGLGARF